MFYISLGRSFLISSAPLPEFTPTTWTMAIAGLIIFIAASIFFFRRLKAAAKEEPFLGPHAILTKFRDLRDKGALSEEEFRRIKLLMADKIAGEDNNASQEEQ